LDTNLSPWLSGLTLLELQCSEPGWLVHLITDGRGQRAYTGRPHVGTCQRNPPA